MGQPLHTLPTRKSAVWPHQLQFSTCVTPYINNTPHVRRHSCSWPSQIASHALLYTVCVCVLDREEEKVCERVWFLCSRACVCGVKEAIHEQLAGVKST